jgi:gliding motility-associated-like protein
MPLFPTALTGTILLSGMLLCAYPIDAQVIVTVAGTGQVGFSGDGGPATAATLNVPTSIAFDKSGNLLIADQQNAVIRKLDLTTGIITTIAGNGGQYHFGDGGLAQNAGLYGPTGLTVDKTGNIFIAEEYGSTIRKIDATTGIITTVAAIPGAGFDYSGDGGPALNASFYQPTDVAVDASGNLYIADWGNNVVRGITAATGIINSVAGHYPGNPGYTGDGGQAAQAELNACARIFLDPTGNLLIGDQGNNVIRRVNISTGIINTIIGTGVSGYAGDGGLANNALLNQPSAVIMDANGVIYVADSYNNVIRMVDPSTGIISTIAGNGVQGYSGDGGSPLNASFYRPVDLAIDAAGNLYIADARNNVIRKINLCLQAAPAVSITQSPGTLCTSNPIFMAVPTNGGGSPTYQWKLDGLTTGTSSPTYAGSDLVNGEKVTCILTNNAFCGATATAVSNAITVTGPLTATLIDKGTGCAMDTLLIKASDPLTQITWYDGTIPVGTITAPPNPAGGTVGGNNGVIDTAYIPTAAGSYTAFLTGESGCTTTSNAINIKPTITPSVSISASASAVCTGASASFTATPSDGGATPAYQWQVNGINTATNTAVFTSATLKDQDIVTCVLTSDAICALPATAVSNSVPMTVSPLPEITPTPNITLPAGQSITLGPQVTGDVNWYSWSPGTGLSDSTIPDPVASPAITTLYTLTVKSAEGCMASATIKVGVYGNLRVPNAFTPNGDGRNDVFYVLGGPPGSSIEDLWVYNRWGQKIFQAHDAVPGDPGFGWNGMYNGAPASAGVYVYSLTMRYSDGTRQQLQGTVLLVR